MEPVLTLDNQCERWCDDFFQDIALALADHGLIVIENAFAMELIGLLQQRAIEMHPSEFHLAGVGRQLMHQTNTGIRRDTIHWLDESQAVDVLYLQLMNELRLALNRLLFLGLNYFEAHYAHYEPGAYYRRHVDAFKGESNRILTTVCYLNSDWPDSAGGELQVYANESESLLISVRPHLGTLVIFLSENYPHEVCPAQQDRYSIAGWFRQSAPLLP